MLAPAVPLGRVAGQPRLGKRHQTTPPAQPVSHPRGRGRTMVPTPDPTHKHDYHGKYSKRYSTHSPHYYPPPARTLVHRDPPPFGEHRCIAFPFQSRPANPAVYGNILAGSRRSPTKHTRAGVAGCVCWLALSCKIILQNLSMPASIKIWQIVANRGDYIKHTQQVPAFAPP